MRDVTGTDLRKVALGSGVAALLLSVLGCPRDDPNRQLVSGPDAVVTDVTVAPPDIPAPPSGAGTIDRFFLVGVPPGETNAFGRATGELPQWFDGCCFWWPDWDRNASTDPRLPALVDDDAAPFQEIVYNFDPVGWEVFGDPGDEVHDWFIHFQRLARKQVYVLGLVRYALEVRGTPDAIEVLLGGEVQDPDSLFPLGGTLGGSARRRADLFNCDLCGYGGRGDPYPWEPNANPFLFGFAETDDGGSITFDAVISACTEEGEQGDGDACRSSPAVTYTGSADISQANSPVAPNEFSAFTFPNYNYLVIWEADFVRNPVTREVIPSSVMPRFDRPAVRIQMGVDLDGSGNPIPEAYAPFPTAPLTLEQLEGSTAAIRPSRVELDLSNVEALSGSAVYRLWLYNDVTGTITAAVGNHTTLEADTVVDSRTGVGSFTGGDAGLVHRWEISDETSPDSIGLFTHLVITVEPDANAGPGDARVIWYEMSDQGGTPSDFFDDRIFASGPVVFGRFAERRAYTVSGSGLGNLFGDEFRVNFENLPRPPIGYQYVGWLVTDTSAVRLPDESFTSPPREYASLAGADTGFVSDVVTTTTILAATQRVCAVGGVPNCFGPVNFRAFDAYRLILEPKAGVPAAAPTIVLQGHLP